MCDESDNFLEEYLKAMSEKADEVFGFHYIDEYVKIFPKKDEQSVRRSLTRFAESFHKGHNSAAVILLINKGYIKFWLENDDVRDGYGRLIL